MRLMIEEIIIALLVFIIGYLLRIEKRITKVETMISMILKFLNDNSKYSRENKRIEGHGSGNN